MYIQSIQLVSSLQTILNCLVFLLFTWWELCDCLFVCTCNLVM